MPNLEAGILPLHFLLDVEGSAQREVALVPILVSSLVFGLAHDSVNSALVKFYRQVLNETLI
jgi:hypothetical protein